MDHSEEFRIIGSLREGLSDDEWVQNRLASLSPPFEWQPNVDVGIALLKQGRRSALAWRQRFIYSLTGLIVTGVLLAFPATRVLAKRCVDGCVAGTSAVGHVLGIAPAIQPKNVREHKSRDMAPELHLKDRYGNAIELASLRGQVVVLNFWATWCGPCKIEIPWFMEFQQTFHNTGLTFLGVSMDEDGWNSVGPYLDQHKMTYPVAIGDDKLAQVYGGIETLPMTFLIDKSGRIAAVHTGLIAKAIYEDEIKRLMAE